MLTVVIAEGVAIALLAVLVLGLLRSHALILKALHELGAGLELEAEAGGTRGAGDRTTRDPVALELETGVVAGTRPSTSKARDLVGSGLDGAARGIGVAEGRHLLAFLSSGCTVCQTFWSEFSGGVEDVPGRAQLVVVTKGAEEESASTLRRLAGPTLPVLQSTAAWDVYGIPGSPYFVFVEDGVITGEGSSTTWPQVRDLMSQAVEDTSEARAAAGRTGPGAIGIDRNETDGSEDKDSLPRMDRELRDAGIHPGHASLYESPDSAPHDHTDHDHTDHDHAGHDHPSATR